MKFLTANNTLHKHQYGFIMMSQYLSWSPPQDINLYFLCKLLLIDVLFLALLVFPILSLI